MKTLGISLLSIITASLLGCSSVKLPESNQYQLNEFSSKQKAVRGGSTTTILVSQPDSVAGYQTSKMLYVKKPFQVEAFAKNAWTNPPADMLYPLIVESLQKSNYFYAVTTNAYSGEAEYRLDTQVLAFEQNFLKTPSVLEFSVKVVLTHIKTNQALDSRIISLHIRCPTDTPYGGVLAANRASSQFTALVTDFVVAHIK